jgi:hypothetical protein
MTGGLDFGLALAFAFFFAGKKIPLARYQIVP